MPKKQNVSVEIVRTPSPTDMKAMLEQMMKDQFEKLMAERDLEQLAPAYRSSRIRPIYPGFEREKYGLYFEKWGCEVCGRKDNVSHIRKGRCELCNTLYHQRIAALEREWISKNPDSQIVEDIDHLTRRLRTAQELFREVENGEESPAEATELSHSRSVMAYRKNNRAASKCTYCPRPLAPKSIHYCEECLRKKREGKRKRREDFKARLPGGRALLGKRHSRTAEALLVKL
jgi:hypothetical protein